LKSAFAGDRVEKSRGLIFEISEVTFVKILRHPLCPRAGSATNGGFSLIEVLVAALLLLVIALGLIPLFTRAMIDNASGRDATTATNFDRTQLETMSAVPFDFAKMTVPNGQPFLESEESFSRGTLNVDNDSGEVWTAGVPTNLATVRWTRRTRVRQYQAIDVKGHVFASPKVGGTDEAFVQVKEVEVMIQGANRSATLLGNVLGGGPQVTFRLMSAY
jgi:prepilin-type N-terminal cleavage/methylation domain-containing protein